MKRARLALLATVAALVTAPAVIHAQDESLASVQRHLAPDGWTDVAKMVSVDSVGVLTPAYFGGLMNRSDWTNPAADCATVEDGVNRLFKEVYWYVGDNGGMWGEYYSDVVLNNGDTIQIAVFDRQLYNNPADALALLLHEGAHHSEYTHTVRWVTQTVCESGDGP